MFPCGPENPIRERGGLSLQVAIGDREGFGLITGRKSDHVLYVCKKYVVQ